MSGSQSCPIVWWQSLAGVAVVAPLRGAGQSWIVGTAIVVGSVVDPIGEHYLFRICFQLVCTKTPDQELSKFGKKNESQTS